MKVYGICTDNASCMRKAWLIISEKYPHIQCYGCVAHTFNLLAKDIVNLKTAGNVKDSATRVVKEIKNSQILSGLMKNDSNYACSLKMPSEVR